MNVYAAISENPSAGIEFFFVFIVKLNASHNYFHFPSVYSLYKAQELALKTYISIFQPRRRPLRVQGRAGPEDAPPRPRHRGKSG